MSKYIDAGRLKEILKSQIKERKKWMKDPAKSDRQDQLWSDLNGEDMSILQTINSLQQEQSSLPDDLANASKMEQPRGYDEAYLNECIAKASKTWKDVNVDDYMDEVRGREPDNLDEAAEEWVRPIMRIPDKAHKYLYTYLLDAFKAGAEWAMQQLKVE